MKCFSSSKGKKRLAALGFTITLVFSSIVLPFADVNAAVKEIDDSNVSFSSGEYGGYWASNVNGGFYRQNGLHLVGVTAKNLQIYDITKDFGAVRKNTVTLPNYDIMGGFYHGKKDMNYVVVGYTNYKEQKNKVVIKVLQYDKNWKLKKTASIKSGGSNNFGGIYEQYWVCYRSRYNDGHVVQSQLWFSLL